MIQFQSISDHKTNFLLAPSSLYSFYHPKGMQSYKTAIRCQIGSENADAIFPNHKAAKKDLIYRPYPSRSLVDQDYVEKIAISVSYLGLKIEFSLPDGPDLKVSSEKILFKYPSGIFL